MTIYTLKVVDIRKESEDSITLCFKQPALRKIKYKAGQYLTLIFRINGRRYIRPYSFSSAPLLDPLLEVTVKRVLNGVVSNHIHDKVQIGDAIEVMEAMGDFVFQDKNDLEELYFWGVGSGITPLISIIKYILHSDSPIKLFLIYGNRNFESTLFDQLIRNLISNYPDRLTVWHFHSKLSISHDNSRVSEGRISKESILKIVESAKSNSQHFICGPSGLKESVKQVLSDNGVPSTDIFSEDFELEKNPKDFEHVTTQNIKLKFENIDHTLEVVRGKSILEASLDAGIELPYSCQTGNCNTCSGTLISGNINMIGVAKERKDLKPNEYLLCCSYPLSDDVSVEI